MPFEGYVGYKRREYCNSVKCPVQLKMNEKGEGSKDYADLREICKAKCLHTAHEFHRWLNEKGFEIARKE